MESASTSVPGAPRLRLALLVALNALLVAALWFVARPLWAGAGGAQAGEDAPERATLPDSLPSAVPAHLPARLPAGPVGSEPAPAGFAVAVAAPRRERELERRIETVVAAALQRAEALSKGRVRAREVAVAVHVRDARDGAELAARGAGRAMRPASNLKLATSAAALVLLGPDWRFETRCTSAAPVEAGVLRGDLVVHAAGDPLFDAASAGDVRALLAPAARELSAAGVRRIEGALVLDEGRFQAPAAGPEWPDPGQRWAEYCALAGGFSANAGCLSAWVVPGREGRAAEVELRPRGHGLPAEIEVRTGAARSKLDLRVSAQGGHAVVRGSVPAGSAPREWRFAAPDPVALFGAAFVAALGEQGIQLGGGVVREHRTPSVDARVLARLATPLARVLEPINAHSNNACADQLFLALGATQFGRGDREGGGLAVGLALERLGVPGDGFVQVDGSGLSRTNRISARQVTALLAGVLARGGAAAELLVESLAAPGEDGTLEGRMAELAGRVRAKTGFIGGTSALSGLVDAADGRRLAFSILVEYPEQGGLNTQVWKPMQDEICAILAGGSGG
jgi:D-alanyl-D-alanine carboxypeptidase/D-alanyl-D-alanine-endopeptidase (penicillin-binding protein 4)